MKSQLAGLKFIEELELKDKRVFLRLDLNVPMQDGKIADLTRIEAALPTIKYCRDKGAKLVLASHFGRPKSADDKKYSLEPVAEKLGELLGLEVLLIEDPTSDAPKVLLKTLLQNQILLLENLRFNEGETEDSEDFARELASYTDVYVNDAFGASHRAHASIHRLPLQVKQKAYGFLIKKEVEMLEKLLIQKESPFLAILGGSKVSDKIPVLENLMDRVDGFLIGGAMAYTFLSAQGIPIGESKVEKDKLKYAKELIGRMEARNKFLLLPTDHVCVTKFTDPSTLRVTPTPAINSDEMAVDIGPKTRMEYANRIASAKMIFWNGPMGVFETPEYAEGTFTVARAVAECMGFTLVGGGDSVSAVNQAGVGDKVTHISTGGGASLELLQGERLPGLQALKA